MKKNKIKCPVCVSSNIMAWRNEYCVAYYELDKDGILDDEKPIGKPQYQVCGGDGYQCKDCDETFKY